LKHKTNGSASNFFLTQQQVIHVTKKGQTNILTENHLCPWLVLFSPQIMNPSSYLPVVLQLAAALGFVVLVLVLTHLIGPSRKTAAKQENFECGIESTGNARFPVSVKYFLTAILFVLFDVEVIFFYPYAVNMKEMGWEGFFAVLMFVAFFLVGFFYVKKRGALEWEK
jgi:NADH-quinone oxidoreductase subunit A